jgi:hypothetical protein
MRRVMFILKVDSMEDNKKYYAFLKRIRNKIDDDLYKYFKEDYFHDGNMLDYKYDNALRKLSFIINCPNYIETRTGAYFNVFYNIIFYGVKKIILDYNSDSVEKKSGNIIFRFSEIMTLVGKQTEYKNDESIIVEFLDGDRCGFLNVIFSYVNVDPVEPLAYKMLIENNTITPPC